MARKKNAVDRRNFLKSAAVGAAVLAATPAAAATGTPLAKPLRKLPPPMLQEAEEAPPARMEVLTEGRSGSDFMVDVMKAIGIEYICANPGASFRGLQESFINYGNNQNPEFLTCCHEESSVAMAHGYAKIEGKPLLVMVHSTVGLQHATMAIYNAFCDRVPVFVIAGNMADAAYRIPPVEWAHSAQDLGALVRDFTKWDDQPMSLTAFAESAMRAYGIAMTPPQMPVLLVADCKLQEDPVPAYPPLTVPKVSVPTPPQGETAAVAEAARMLVDAEMPVIVADRCVRTAAGLTALIELAETLQAAVVAQPDRMNFPSRHPLNQTESGHEVISQADVVMGLEAANLYGAVHSCRDQIYRSCSSIIRDDTKLISITADDLFIKSNYQEFQPFRDADLEIAADAETTLPSLTEAVRRLLTPERRRFCEERGKKLAAMHQQGLERARTLATFAWDASPISTARLSAELWGQIHNEDWSLVSPLEFVNWWPLRLWDVTKHYQYNGASGGFGLGYGLSASVGAALANRKYGRISVNIQDDGDGMYAPSVLWTAAHHHIPLLTVMHNNLGYQQEVMELQIMADRRNRGINRCTIGTTLTDPDIDYGRLAESMGMHGEGPISDPDKLGPAIQRAKEVVKRGEPALIDVRTQPR